MYSPRLCYFRINRCTSKSAVKFDQNLNIIIFTDWLCQEYCFPQVFLFFYFLFFYLFFYLFFKVRFYGHKIISPEPQRKSLGRRIRLFSNFFLVFVQKAKKDRFSL